MTRPESRTVDLASPAPAPLALTGRSIVCISSIDWNFLWQGNQEIMSRFAAAGNHVLFVENTGVRTIRPADLRRILRRLENWLAYRRQRGLREPVPGVTLVAPLLLPFPTWRLARAVNQRILLPRLARQLKRLEGEDPIIFTFLPTPNAVRLVELLRGPASVVIYYCVADFQELSDLGADLDASESKLASMADLVFVLGAAFATRLSGLNPRIHEFQPGVNFALFDVKRAARGRSEIARLPRPIVGYTGGLHRYIDFGLLVEVARAIPDGSLVLVGPVVTDVPAALRARHNVHFLGIRPVTQLPDLVMDFDVALIPYARTAFMETVFPHKLHEYFALGRPVVSTDLPEVVKLGLPPSTIAIGRDTREFVDLVRRAIDEDSSGAAEERIALARTRDWRRIVMEMAELIERRSRSK